MVSTIVDNLTFLHVIYLFFCVSCNEKFDFICSITLKLYRTCLVPSQIKVDMIREIDDGRLSCGGCELNLEGVQVVQAEADVGHEVAGVAGMVVVFWEVFLDMEPFNINTKEKYYSMK